MELGQQQEQATLPAMPATVGALTHPVIAEAFALGRFNN
jgi:hypothetical protein